MRIGKSTLRAQAANMLTAIRIIASLTLLFLSPLSVAFYIVYALCGLTDLLDGAVARRFGSTSRFGALLDSIADLAFVIASAVRLLPLLYPRLPAWWIYPLLAIAAVKLASLVVGAVKFRKPCFLHTYLNKAAGAVVFLLPFFYGAEWFPAAVGIACAVAWIAAADEFACVVKMTEYDAESKGLLL